MDPNYRPIPVPRKSKQRVVETEVVGECSADHRVDERNGCSTPPPDVTASKASAMPLLTGDSFVHLDLSSDSDASSVLSWSSSVHKELSTDKDTQQTTSCSPEPQLLLPSQTNVCFVGWLRARRPKAKSSSSIWGVLKESALYFYRDDNCERLLDTLPCSNILLVAKEISSDNRNDIALHYVHPKHRKVKCRILSVESEQDLCAWITLIGKSFLKEEIADLDGVLDAVGKAYVKQGTTASWTMANLAKRGLSFFYSTGANDCVYELDIRKVISIKTTAEKLDCCSLCKEKGYCFAIMMENSTLWFQADCKSLTACWKATFESLLKKRSNVLAEQRLSSDDVPIIVEKCVNFISIYGLQTEGIHRLSGASSKIDELCNLFVSDPFKVHLIPEQHSVHTVASVLRKFLSQLVEPLVPAEVTLHLVACAMDDRSSDANVESYKSALRLLPTINHATLRKLIKHLREVTLYSEINKMNVKNIACIFAPTIFRISKDESATDEDQTALEKNVRTFKVMADLILNFDEVFEISAEESFRESQVHRALSKLNTFSSTPVKLNSGFLHSLHVLEKDKISFNIKIGVDLSAENVCDYVKSRGIDSLPSDLALYEVICDGQLERVVAVEESVFDILMRWMSWPLKDRAGNYLIVKEDVWTDKAIEYAQRSQAQSRWITCYVSQSKSFVKQSLILMPNEIMLFKSQKDTTAEQIWRISDHLWFVGAEAKRHPPARFNVTFIRNCEFLIRSRTFPYLGITLSFKQESDQLRLLAGVLQTPPVCLNCF